MTFAVALFLHSWNRWLLLVLGLALVTTTGVGWRRGADWAPTHERLHLAFLASMYVQLGVGLWLYLVASPLSRAFLADPGGTMGLREVRFFGLEHITVMLLAVVVAQAGRTLSRRRGGWLRHRAVARSVIAFLLIVATSVPWPFAPTPRPWFRSFSEAAPARVPWVGARSGASAVSVPVGTPGRPGRCSVTGGAELRCAW